MAAVFNYYTDATGTQGTGASSYSATNDEYITYSLTKTPEEVLEELAEAFKKIAHLLKKPIHTGTTIIKIFKTQIIIKPEIKRRLMFSLSGWLLKNGRLKRKGN